MYFQSKDHVQNRKYQSVSNRKQLPQDISQQNVTPYRLPRIQRPVICHSYTEEVRIAETACASRNGSCIRLPKLGLSISKAYMNSRQSLAQRRTMARLVHSNGDNSDITEASLSSSSELNDDVDERIVDDDDNDDDEDSFSSDEDDEGYCTVIRVDIINKHGLPVKRCSSAVNSGKNGDWKVQGCESSLPPEKYDKCCELYQKRENMRLNKTPKLQLKIEEEEPS